MVIANLRLKTLRIAVLAALYVLLACLPPAIAGAAADSDPAARTVAAGLSRGPVVVELFSSQACLFCPRADRLLADLAGQVHVIALACHVDYFDVREGALSHPFCSARQDMYMRALRGGPNYTPQMIVQGRFDAIGYDMKAVAAALQKATAHVPPAILIVRTGGTSTYRLKLPAARVAGDYRLSVLVFDDPHLVTVAEGRNKGQKMNYVNIVSSVRDLGVWDGAAAVRQIDLVRAEAQRGFVVMAQDVKTGTIAAAGRYLFAVARDVPPAAPQIAPPPENSPEDSPEYSSEKPPEQRPETLEDAPAASKPAAGADGHAGGGESGDADNGTGAGDDDDGALIDVGSPIIE